MKRFLVVMMGLSFVLGGVAEAKPKHKGKDKKIPPGQLKKMDGRHKGPPAHVYDKWERDRVYTWEDQRYRWRDDRWIVELPGGVIISR